MIFVLYVDDEPALLEIGKLFLERSGQFSVDIITSAQDALSLLKSKDYDVILSDYQMPEMDGIDIFKKNKKFRETQSRLLFPLDEDRKKIDIEAINNRGGFLSQKWRMS